MTQVHGAYYKLIAIAIAMGMVVFMGCQKERYAEGTDVRLTFSEEALLFDTVFTQMGSTTRQIKVYNRNSGAVKIDYVKMRKGRGSSFRLNVDGDTSLVAKGIEIAGNDSMYIFVQVLIDPNDEQTPFLATDSIVFGFNGIEQEYTVSAYGRNAVYHIPDASVYDAFGNEYRYSVIDCDNWNHNLPHIIMGYAVVDEGCTLRLRGGERVYMGSKSYLWVYDGGTLEAVGETGNPVVFSSVRHDGWYDTLPGQWGYIWLSSGSKDNRIEWARIENGTVGVVVDTNVNGRPTLTIRNTVIENHSLSGIVGQTAWIEGDNLLIDNCGVTLLSLQYGGRYRFANSTFANYWRYNSRSASSVILNNYYTYQTSIYPRALEQADFSNCIIYGSYMGRDSVGELTLDRYEGEQFSYSLQYCLVKTWTTDSTEQGTTIFNEEPKFVDPRGHNLHLQEGSPAIGAGSAVLLTQSSDIEGRMRKDPPTIGVYEYEAVGGRGRGETQRREQNQEKICTTTLGEGLKRRRQPMQSSTATVWVTCSKSASTPIQRLKISRR